MYGQTLSILFILFGFLCSMISTEDPKPYCSKIDFNRPTFTEFRECRGKFLPLFSVKSYSGSSAITPFRPTSKYYLSTNVEGYTCAESSSKYSLNESSRIDSAIFLSFENAGAFVEILVVDTDKNIPVYSWKNDSSTNWYRINGRIKNKIPNAQIEIHTNMNKNSRLAIEYINIINLAIETDECSRNIITTTTPSTETEMPTVTTPRPSSSLPETTTESISTTHDSSETTENPNDDVSQSFLEEHTWRIICAILAFILIITILFFVYVLMKCKRYYTLKVSQNNSIHKSHTSLPRLYVVNDEINGISIKGNDQTKENGTTENGGKNKLN